MILALQVAMANLNITKLFDSGLNPQRRQRKAEIEKIHLKPYRKSEGIILVEV